MKRVKCIVEPPTEGTCDLGPKCTSDDGGDNMESSEELCLELFGDEESTSVSRSDQHNGLRAGPSMESIAGPSSSAAGLPDALTPMEMEILRDLECRNEKIREYELAIGYHWNDPCINRPSSDTRRPTQHTGTTPERDRWCDLEEGVFSELSEAERRRLEEKRRQLQLELTRLTPIIESFRRRGLYQFGAGPCNGRSNEPFRGDRSRRLLRAGLEAMHETDCNRASEIQCEIYEITTRLHCANRNIRHRFISPCSPPNCHEASE
ncbi:hypothetical protein QAD02_016206 [Eretmocerus hayati]|uniref:Uncharacterized protein n=1 Tax=Eretmocerus hayati TaxID=131215 RepID=A0ACC2PCV4_9HYME|nr:hypothetical protein QAD02_016206 [Eretmocerus hayati]